MSTLTRECFDGGVPLVLSACAADDRSLALSCQFFRKTRANLAAGGS